MIQHVKEHSIEHKPTTGYSPQSNGVAQHYNRTLFEMACMMLDSSGTPLELWADAILTANHILNRLPAHTIDDITPFEGWNGYKPTISHIRKLGCKVYRHINKDTGRKKCQKKSMIGFLVGYETRVMYRIFYPMTKEFKRSRDIMFDETEFLGMRTFTAYSEVLRNGRRIPYNIWL
jgi:hypothetical protein